LDLLAGFAAVAATHPHSEPAAGQALKIIE
jgi:hypothetical protein